MDEFTKIVQCTFGSFIGHNYSIKSTNEFIEILKPHKPNKEIISSLDVKNLFTNVPVLETIHIIINNIYQRSSHSKSTPILYTKYFYPALLRYHFTIPMETYTPKRMELQWGQFWDPFSVIFTCQPLKIRFFNTINKPNIYLRYTDNILFLTISTDVINII